MLITSHLSILTTTDTRLDKEGTHLKNDRYEGEPLHQATLSNGRPHPMNTPYKDNTYRTRRIMRLMLREYKRDHSRDWDSLHYVVLLTAVKRKLSFISLEGMPRLDRCLRCGSLLVINKWLAGEYTF